MAKTPRRRPAPRPYPGRPTDPRAATLEAVDRYLGAVVRQARAEREAADRPRAGARLTRAIGDAIEAETALIDAILATGPGGPGPGDRPSFDWHEPRGLAVAGRLDLAFPDPALDPPRDGRPDAPHGRRVMLLAVVEPGRVVAL